MAIQDTDIFVVQRGEQAYKMPATQLNDYVDTGGGEPGPSTDTLQDVCARGDAAICNRDMTVNGRLTFQDGSSQTSAAVTKIQAGNNITIDPTSGTGTVTINASTGGHSHPTPTLDQVCRASVDPNGYASTSTNLGVSGNLSIGGSSGFQNITCRAIAGQGQFQVQAGNGTDGRVLVPAAVNLTGGVSQPLRIRVAEGGDKGLLQAIAIRSADNYVGDVDTSNWCEVLKKITISNYGPEIPIGINTQKLHSESATTFMTYDETYDRDELVPAFLVGVCQRQQELIETLTARVAALEADHTAAMSNMGDSSY